MKKSAVLLVIILTAVLLTGCLTKDSEIYGWDEVQEYIDSVCDEPYELTAKQLIEESPDNMEYTFHSKQRDLSFTANSYLSPIYFDATKTAFYNRSISCTYVSEVHGLYRQELDGVLNECPYYLPDRQWMYVTSFSELDQVIDCILKADNIYRPEVKYHDSWDFLKKNPLTSIHLIWISGEENPQECRQWVNLTDLSVTGQNSREELKAKLGGIYAQKYVDKEINNGDDIPESFLESRHVSSLDHIYLNGKEMLYDRRDNPYNGYGLSTASFKKCWYNDKYDSYMMILDIGYLSDSTSIPLIIREYVYALGGNYEASAEGSHYLSRWSVGNDTWEMQTDYSDNTISRIQITKNGKPLEIHFLTADEDSNVGATFCIGVTVQDFCRLFNLSCQALEEDGVMKFTSLP